MLFAVDKDAAIHDREEVSDGNRHEGRPEGVDQDGDASGVRADGAGPGRGRAGEGRLATSPSRPTQRVTALLMPWWERDPAQLATLLRELRASGFRVRRGTDQIGRLVLAASKDGRRYQIISSFDADRALELREVTGARRERWTWRPLSEAVSGLMYLATEAVVGRSLPPDLAEPILIHPSWANWSVTFGRGGLGTLRVGRSRFGFGVAALGLTGVSGSRRATTLASAALSRAFPVVVNGLWARANHPDDALDIEGQVAAVEHELARSHRLSRADVSAGLRVGFGALLRPQSDVVRNDDWLFVRRSLAGEPVVLDPYGCSLGVSRARAPYADGLTPRRVLIVGCGAMGWTVATQLARSGVREFVLFDADRVGEWNLSRLGAPLGLVGVAKVHALAAHLESVATGVDVRARRAYVGMDAAAGALIAERPDLIIDVSANATASDHTNVAALSLGVPVLYAWVSQSVVGARIVRVRPYATACYECLREARLPRIRSRGDVPTTGPEDTWDGALFDVEAVAAAVVRVAVLTLTGKPLSAQNPDHVVLTLRGVTPHRRTVRVERNPACRVCGDDDVEVAA